MRTEIINIGDELLIGQVVNTNASWMSEKLNLAGFPVHQITTIADDQQQIIETVNEALQRAEIVLITGGLGPTRDDITKEALTHFFNTKLVFDQTTFQTIENYFKARGIIVSEVNRKQAEVPGNCTIIYNEYGTAPGMWFEYEVDGGQQNHILVSMPGVPFEMKAMLTNGVIPKLKKQFQPISILHHTILTQGIGESYLSDLLTDWESHLPQNLHLAYLPQPGIVRLRVTGQGDDEFLLNNLMTTEIEKLKQIISAYIFGENEDTLESIIGTLLREKEFTVSTAESCTAGYIAHLITSVAGSSLYYKGSIVAYSNEIKMMELGVNEATLNAYGAVSEEVAKEMATNIRTLFKTDYSISATGIAGPDGGTKDKPVGTVWVGIDGPSGVIAKKYYFGDNRERNIRRTSLQALNLLRKTILAG
jgi:nicotinamide-nucleotide amidase